MVRVASEQFTFLAGAASPPEIVVADGRLALEDVPTATYDLLVLDAFSSDAIPVHLLTVEAMQEALRVVRPGGLVAYHLSNLYYDLVPAVAAGAEQLGLPARARSFRPTERQIEGGAVPSDWLVVAGDPAALAGIRSPGLATRDRRPGGPDRRPRQPAEVPRPRAALTIARPRGLASRLFASRRPAPSWRATSMAMPEP